MISWYSNEDFEDAQQKNLKIEQPNSQNVSKSTCEYSPKLTCRWAESILKSPQEFVSDEIQHNWYQFELIRTI